MRLNFRTIALAGLMLGCTAAIEPARATTFGDVEFVCPVGGEKFTAPVMMSTSVFGRRLDLKPLPLQSIDSYPKCPGNKFVIYENSFTPEQVEKLTALIAAREYLELSESHATHYLAAYLLRATSGDAKRIAYEIRTAIWECEDSGCPHRDAYVAETVAAFDALLPGLTPGSIDWVDATYLSAEYQRQRGEFADAAARLKLLRETPNELDAENKAGFEEFAAKVQSFVAAGNSDPAAGSMMAE